MTTGIWVGNKSGTGNGSVNDKNAYLSLEPAYAVSAPAMVGSDQPDRVLRSESDHR